MPTVVLIGTLDTKGQEYAFLADRVREHGCDVLLVDVGVLGEPSIAADVGRAEVAPAAGADVTALAAEGDRGAAVEAMARGAAAVVKRLHAEGRLDGVAALGGSGGSSIATHAMRELPVGMPKLMVSTLASGDTRPYVGAVDVTMTYSVVDIAGINQVSARILSNAAGAIAGMAKATTPSLGQARPLVAASMFGVTTPCVTAARERLEELGYEVLVFHATGTGGQSMEALMRGGFVIASLDVTTTELADDLVGGVLSAGPDRLEAAGALGDPAGRLAGCARHGQLRPARHGSAAVRRSEPLRPQPDRDADAHHARGVRRARAAVASKLNAARGPTALFVPLRGVSMIAVDGQPFHDAAADEALFGALREHLDPRVEAHWLELDVNDPVFARAMAERLHEMIAQPTA